MWLPVCVTLRLLQFPKKLIISRHKFAIIFKWYIHELAHISPLHLKGNYTFRAKSSAVLMDKLFDITKKVISEVATGGVL